MHFFFNRQTSIIEQKQSFLCKFVGYQLTTDPSISVVDSLARNEIFRKSLCVMEDDKH